MCVDTITYNKNISEIGAATDREIEMYQSWHFNSGGEIVHSLIGRIREEQEKNKQLTNLINENNWR